MPNILLLGGTGNTGQCFVKRYAKDGTKCFIVTRNKDNYSGFTNENVGITECKIFDPQSVKECIEANEIDVVVNVLGFLNLDDDGKCSDPLKCARAMINGMKQTSCKRYMDASTWWASPDSRNCKDAGCMQMFVFCCMPKLSQGYTGHHNKDEYLKNEATAAGIEWTVCRAPLLVASPAPPNQQKFATEIDGNFVPGINLWAGSYDCLARFMYENIENDDFKGKIVAFGRDGVAWHCCCC